MVSQPSQRRGRRRIPRFPVCCAAIARRRRGSSRWLGIASQLSGRNSQLAYACPLPSAFASTGDGGMMIGKFTTSIAAALLMGTASLAMNAPAAAAFRPGGGGGGFHGGGGVYGGGGGFHCGGFHFGGGHFGGSHFGINISGCAAFWRVRPQRFAFHRSFGGARASRHATTGYAAGRPFGPPTSARKSRARSRVGPARRTQLARTAKPETFDTGNSDGGIFIAAT